MAIPNKPAVRTINDNNKIWSYSFSLGLWGPGKIEIINSGKSNGIF